MYAPRFKRYQGILTLGTSQEAREYVRASVGKSRPACQDQSAAELDAIRRLRKEGGDVKDKVAILSFTKLQFGKYQGEIKQGKCL